MQKLLNVITEFSDATCFYLNAKKTVYMSNSVINNEGKVFYVKEGINEEIMDEGCINFKYLGVTLTLNLVLTQQREQSIQIVRRSMNIINSRIFGMHHKIMIINSLIIPN